MTLPTLTPREAQALLAGGARLIDVRGADEFARERIPGAQNVPLDRLDALGPCEGPVVFHCRSGMRTAANAQVLARAAGGAPCHVLEGGLDAWRAAGLPVAVNARAPLEMQRQVQIAAGVMVLAGVVLSLTVAPAFLGLSAFVGAGLIFAGASGWCGLARVLARAPWNRRAA